MEPIKGEIKLKISGCANLSSEPKRTNMFIDMSIKNATLIDDIDIRGTESEPKDWIYKIKITPETEITILAENEIITARKRGSQSQKLRSVLFELFNQQFSGEGGEFEHFYTSELSKIIDKYKKQLI